jgi:hypothetical protein
MTENNKYIFPTGFAKQRGLNKDPTFWEISPTLKHPVPPPDASSSGQTQTLGLGILKWRLYHCANDKVQRFLNLEKVWAFRCFFIGRHRVCRMSENNKYIFPTGFAKQRGLNKDPTLWLDGATPPPKKKYLNFLKVILRVWRSHNLMNRVPMFSSTSN